MWVAHIASVQQVVDEKYSDLHMSSMKELKINKNSMDEIINYEWIDPSGCIWLLSPGSYNLNITFLWIYCSRKSTNYNCISIDYIFFLSHLECAWDSISIFVCLIFKFWNPQILIRVHPHRGFHVYTCHITSRHVLWQQYDARAKNVTLLGGKLTQSIFWSPVRLIAKLSTKEK